MLDGMQGGGSAYRVEGGLKQLAKVSRRALLKAQALMGHLWPEDGAVSAGLGGRAHQGSAHGGYALNYKPTPQWNCRR